LALAALALVVFGAYESYPIQLHLPPPPQKKKKKEKQTNKTLKSVSLRISENSLTSSQIAPLEKFSGAILTEIQWIFTDSQTH